MNTKGSASTSSFPAELRENVAIAPPETDPWINLLVTFLVILFFSWIGIVLSWQSQGIATIWFSNGILFAIVINKPQRVWVRYFIISFLADTLADILWGDHFPLAMGVALANSIEVISSTIILSRWFGHPFNLSRRRPLLAFLGVAVIGATAVTSALGASWTRLFVQGGPWWQSFRTWYLGDILGMAIIAPLVYILLRPGFFVMLRPAHLPKTLLFLAIPTLTTLFVFSYSHDPLIFFIFPALLFVVFRLGFPGAVLSIFIIACISIGFTVTGHGPLMLIPAVKVLHRIVIMQLFLAVALFTAFPVAALLEEREALDRSLERSEARYRALASIDALTGLANRRAFDERLQSEWRLALREKSPLALLLIDVDLFKSYNDVYGHLGGDDCLRSIATSIAKTLEPTAHTVTRFGGEEFAIILPNTTLQPALEIAENIRYAIEAMKLPHPYNLSCGVQTISIGVVATIPTQTDTALSLLNDCDRALYSAKNRGRNRVEAIPATGLSNQQPPVANPQTS